MDRMRVGLTGLGVVFLITLGAAFAFGSAGAQAPPENKPGEPLAQLGVAPGAEKNDSVSTPAEAAAKPPAAATEGSGTTVVPAPQNEPVAGSLTLPMAGGHTPTVSI